jgi:hypothetical protein
MCDGSHSKTGADFTLPDASNPLTEREQVNLSARPGALRYGRIIDKARPDGQACD